MSEWGVVWWCVALQFKEKCRDKRGGVAARSRKVQLKKTCTETARKQIDWVIKLSGYA